MNLDRHKKSMPFETKAELNSACRTEWSRYQRAVPSNLIRHGNNARLERSLGFMTTESKGPRTKMLLVYVEATDSSDQPKIKYKDNKLQG